MHYNSLLSSSYPSLCPPSSLPPDVAASVLGEDKFPVLHGWIARMRETKAVKETMLSVEAHVTFVKSAQTGNHDYSPADLSGKGLPIYTCKKD